MSGKVRQKRTGLKHSFQVGHISRPDLAAGAVDVEFNCGGIKWETDCQEAWPSSTKMGFGRVTPVLGKEASAWQPL
jgi:hypothetical protein